MAQDNDFSGVWRSDSHFHSTTRGGDFTLVHFGTMHRKGDKLVFESLEDSDEAYMLARLSLDGPVATVVWQNQMSEHGYYKGMLYQGAAQLVLDKDGKAFRGKWVGYGKGGEIKTGDWEIIKVDGEVPEKHVVEREEKK